MILDFRGVNAQPPELHHALMVADSIVGQMLVGTIHYSDQKTSVATQPENAFGELPMVVIADPIVHGPLGIILAALHKRPNTAFVGTGHIRSRFYCYERVVLENNQGSIRAMPTGQFVAEAVQANSKQRAHQPDSENQDSVTNSDRITSSVAGWSQISVDHVVDGDNANQAPAPHVTRYSGAAKIDFIVQKAVEVAEQMASKK